MSQLKHVVDPFGEVNVYPAAAGRRRVVATILMQPHREGTQTGIALDGSGSMRKLYGLESSRVLSPIFGGPKKATNEITPVAQKVCAYLARNLDADGGTTCIYWAVGPGGSRIQEVGDFTADEAERHTFGPPDDLGTGTQLLPAVKYFVDRFTDAPWGFYVFITDGELHDLDDVLAYSKRLAQDVAAGRRRPVKLVLIGVGPEVNQRQMEELDDLDTGTDVDLWDHKLAAEMRVLEEIFAEVVDKNARVAPSGRILDPHGKVIKNYADVGLPAYLDFELPADASYFTLEVNGARIHQAVVEGFQPPASSAAPVSAAAEAEAQPAEAEMIEELPVDAADAADAEWKSLPLEFGPKDSPEPGVDLDRPKDV
ncbi:MAG: vWA domain-containing protein [Gemmataceae bacterium]